MRKIDADIEGRWARPDHAAPDIGLVHLGCYNPDTTDWEAYQQLNLSLTILETGQSKIKMLAISGCGEGQPPGS